MKNLDNIYWIGGSPCAGKSSIAEVLVKKYGFLYYKCDDHFMRHMEQGVEEQLPTITAFAKMNCDEIWLREVKEQLEAEIEYYKEQFKFILEDIAKYDLNKPLIVEGAALLPECINDLGVPKKNVVYIVPTPEFQLEHYKKREWVSDVLRDCSDPKKAFENWMNRDIAYAERIVKIAKVDGNNLIIVDGEKSIEDNQEIVEAYFKLNQNTN